MASIFLILVIYSTRPPSYEKVPFPDKETCELVADAIDNLGQLKVMAWCKEE